MTVCTHPEIALEVTHRTVLPFKWTIDTLRCVVCDTKALLVQRRKVK